MSAVYSINNSLFATKDLIFGWSFWNEGMTPSPVSELDDEQIASLVKVFNGPLHGDIREALLTEQTRRIGATRTVEIGLAPFGVLTAITKSDTKTDVPTNPPPVRTSENVSPFLKNFTMAPKRWQLVSGSGIEVGGELHQLIGRFGGSWKPIPGKEDTFFARGHDADAKVQMTMRLNKDKIPQEIAVYTEFTFEEFKNNFEKGVFMDCAYYPIGDEWCMGGRILVALKAEGVW